MSRDEFLRPTLIALSAFAAGCSGSALPPTPQGFVCESPTAGHTGLVLAGSGSNLPLARRVAALYTVRTGLEVTVPGSIGTAGAVAALRDGAVDVGLASRPLRPDEAADLVATPMARTSLAFYAAVPDDGNVSLQTLIDLYRGDIVTWRTGQPVVLLVREEGDSGNAVIAGALPELFAAMDGARREGRAIVQSTDHEMWVALRDVPGAVGFLDAGIVALDGLGLRAIGLRDPGGEVLDPSSPSWPLRKTLFLLTSRDRPQPFVDFATRPDIQARLPGWGYEAP